jgi:acyl-[acyl carrier protein]--UDP-N-acetylglucosamine O-acyltransferase
VGINSVGLERRNFDAATTAAIKRSFRTLFYSKLLRDEAIAKVIEQDGGFAEVRNIVDFVQGSERGVVGRSRE